MCFGKCTFSNCPAKIRQHISQIFWAPLGSAYLSILHRNPWHASIQGLQNDIPIFGLRNIWIFEKSKSEGFKKYLGSKILALTESNILNLTDSKNIWIQKFLIESNFKIWDIQKIFGHRNLWLNQSKILILTDSKNIWTQKFLSQSKILNLAQNFFSKNKNHLVRASS